MPRDALESIERVRELGEQITDLQIEVRELSAERHALVARLLETMSTRELARRLGISQPRVAQLALKHRRRT